MTARELLEREMASSTPSQCRALVKAIPGPIRRAKTWSGAGFPGVHWQTVDWLVEHGYLYYPSGSDWAALTEAGRELAEYLP